MVPHFSKDMDDWVVNSNGYWYERGKGHSDSMRVNLIAAYEASAGLTLESIEDISLRFGPSKEFCADLIRKYELGVSILIVP